MEFYTIHANSMSASLMNGITVSTQNISLPGHDGVELVSNYTLPNLSEFLINKIGDKEVVLIGNSIGAMISHQIADKVKLKAIISIGMPPLNYEVIEGAVQENECTALAYTEELSDEQMRTLSKTITDDSSAANKIYENIKTSDPRVRSGLMASIEAGELRDEREILSKLDIPMLFIKCSKDVIINNDRFDNIGFGEVIEVDGGHIFPAEKLDELNKIINEFLSKNGLI